MTTDIGDITNWPPHCFRTPKHCPLCLQKLCECEPAPNAEDLLDVVTRTEDCWADRKDVE